MDHLSKWDHLGTELEYISPWLRYVEGETNILSDNLFHLLCLPDSAQIAVGKKLVKTAVVSDNEDKDEEAYLMDHDWSGIYNIDILEALECYLNFYMIYPEQNPLSYEYLREKQQADKQLLALQQEYPEQYINMNLDDDVDNIICYVKQGHDHNSQWKIALPTSMLDETVKWFHTVMGHPGEKRLQMMLQEWHYHPKLWYTIDSFKCCHCWKCKLSGRGYGLLPEREVRISPWEEVAIDLIGPWTVKVNGRNVKFNA